MHSNQGDRLSPPAGFDDRLPKYQVRVCQNTTCSKSGSAAVLRRFEALDLTDVEVVSSGCLGQCGKGPMVVVLPDQVWYSYVHRQDVDAIATQHLAVGQPVTALLDKTLHPSKTNASQSVDESAESGQRWAYLILIAAVLLAIVGIGWTFVAL